MTTRPTASGISRRGALGASGLLFAACCAPALAANGVDATCAEASADRQLSAREIATPALTIDIVEHGVDSTAAIDEDLIDSTLIVPAAEAAEQDDARIDETDTPQHEIPPTATRLPGVSDSDLPRFRRQMYRTDI